MLAAACQVRTEVAIDVADDGSGTVTVSVGLDPDAVTQVPDLSSELRLDDLRATGWDISGPDVEADGLTWVRATKPFGTAEEAGAVLAEIAGDDGPFQDFAVTRDRSFARTEYGFEGTVDFSGAWSPSATRRSPTRSTASLSASRWRRSRIASGR